LCSRSWMVGRRTRRVCVAAARASGAPPMRTGLPERRSGRVAAQRLQRPVRDRPCGQTRLRCRRAPRDTRPTRDRTPRTLARSARAPATCSLPRGFSQERPGQTPTPPAHASHHFHRFLPHRSSLPASACPASQAGQAPPAAMLATSALTWAAFRARKLLFCAAPGRGVWRNCQSRSERRSKGKSHGGS